MKITFTPRFKRWFGGITAIIFALTYIIVIILLNGREMMFWTLGGVCMAL